MVKFITTEERCWEEGNYIAGVVVDVELKGETE